MRNPMPFFTVMTLMAPLLVAFGAVFGGIWAVTGLLWISFVTATLDEMVQITLPTVGGDEFPAANRLSLTLAVAHFALWVIVIAAIGGATNLETWEKLAVFTGAGLFMGQVSNSNAHELIHCSNNILRSAGRWIYISVLFGHHMSAHTLVHHVHVATPNDPSTAHKNESFYRFLPRAWAGGYLRGLAAENKRSLQSGRPKWRHPYLAYTAGAVLVLLAAALIGGPKGVLAALCLALFSQTQLMMSDYVQHYGLKRKKLPTGKYEPVGTQHSWNAPHLLSSSLMLNAPRHSDHHAHPARAFPALRLDDNMPMLPRSLPVMACLALYPRRWKKVMNPRLALWQDPACAP